MNKYEKTLKNSKNFWCPENVKTFSRIINSTENKKHRFILALLFKLRLTTGQIINLQIRDIKDNILYSRGRRIWIPDSLMHQFYEFSQNKSPDSHLVESNLNKKYSISSIREIRKKALKKCKKILYIFSFQ
jgi:integrase